MLIFINFHINNNNQIKKHQNMYKPYQLYYLLLVKEKMRNKSVNFVVEIK